MLFICLVLIINSFSQDHEFSIYPNGLIYSEATMAKLARIADSLNLKFKSCDLNRVFYANSQTIGHLVKLHKDNLKEAKKDMESGISLEEFMVKYPKATIEKNVLITKDQYIGYNEKEVISFRHFNLKSDYGFSIENEDLGLGQKNLQHTWLFDYSRASGKTSGYIEAFYFPNAFSSNALPARYAQMIGYADCLIDTTTTKLKEVRTMEQSWEGLPENWTKLPVKEKEELLDKLRGTIVMGMCSQDSRPRTHAINIALLSAETSHWEVFLKAHLDIMNDRFERMTDGSYAQGKRNTYIKELEELNINVPDLIFGTIFRIENPSQNHYYGSIGRVGRALAETMNQKDIEDGMLSIIGDPELDDYNRMLFYFLFLNYTHWLPEGEGKKQAEKKLAIVVKKLPDYFRDQLGKN